VIKRSKKAGLPPGTLVHIGEEKTGEIKIAVMDYNETEFQEKEMTSIEECFLFWDRPTVTWLNIDGIHQVDLIQKLGDCYGFHPLMLEDILNSDQRPKVEDYGDYLYIILKMLHFDDASRTVVTEQVSIILGRNFVISFQEGKKGDVFNPIRDRLRSNKGLLRKMGTDYLVYSLMDAIVDNYFVVLEKLGEKIESLEEELTRKPVPATLNLLHKLKREMILLRKSVWPLREVINLMERHSSTLITDSTALYFRDVYDHTIQVIDAVETFRDMLSGMLDIYLSSSSNRLNEVMKVLTIIATLFMPLTFIVGLYGMNFRHMPELEWPWGYPMVLALMIGIVVFMLAYFKRKKWL